MKHITVCAQFFAEEVSVVGPPDEWLDTHGLEGHEMLKIFEDGSIECGDYRVVGFGEISPETYHETIRAMERA